MAKGLLLTAVVFQICAFTLIYAILLPSRKGQRYPGYRTGVED